MWTPDQKPQEWKIYAQALTRALTACLQFAK